MAANRFLGCGIGGGIFERRPVKRAFEAKIATLYSPGPCYGANYRKQLRFGNVVRNCGLVAGENALDYDLVVPSGVVEEEEEESVASTRGSFINGSSSENHFPAVTSTGRRSIQTELIMLSLPAIAGQAIEPLTQLMETAYIGKVGPLALAAAGVSLSIFNILSKVFNIPLLSVATSFVAEDISNNASKNTTSDERIPLPSVSTALVLAVGIGVVEGLAMYLGSGWFLSMMGVSNASPMRVPAQQFLKLRAFGAPAVVVSLAIQGIFRGFKDTKTPVICLGFGNAAAVLFFPIFMYSFRLGVAGAAISTIASQYIVTFMMIWYLNKRTTLLLPNIKNLQFGGYLKSGGFLLGRTLAAVMTITLSTSMAARQGPLAMAAHQICLQVWLSISLLADAQAASGQALIASSFAKRDYSTVKEIAYFALKLGLITGSVLAIVLGLSFSSLATLFTNDTEVLAIIRSVLPIVCASLPFNALAYIYDGLHYGVSDFPCAACSMMIVGAMSSAFLLYAPTRGLSGVWFGLTLFMGLRTVAGYMRLSSKDGPWWFLQEPIQKPQVG